MRARRTAILLVAGLLLGCTPAPGEGAPSRSTPSAADTAATTVEGIVDGDTLETTVGTVRLLGIDTPERGECGYTEAADHVTSLIRRGDPVIIERPAGANDTDQHGRMLRYVLTSDGEDVGMSLLAAGLAVARYDSMDGYPAHPRESDYRAAQVALLDSDGRVVTVGCEAAADAAERARIAAAQQATETPVPGAPLAPPESDEWWLQYTSCTKLAQNQKGHPTGPFARDDPAQAAIYDWFAVGTGNNGDGEGDGLACE
jgi:endonuclease YncB( thermonuclease family)